jgi:hypothetical protein
VRAIARSTTGGTDTSRDYEHTDSDAVEPSAEAVAAVVDCDASDGEITTADHVGKTASTAWLPGLDRLAAGVRPPGWRLAP